MINMNNMGSVNSEQGINGEMLRKQYHHHRQGRLFVQSSIALFLVVALCFVVFARSLYPAGEREKKSFATMITVYSEDDGTVKMRVKLEKPGALRVYYDNQPPLDPSNLDRFWYSEFSKRKKTEHTLELMEVARGLTYHFRLELLHSRKELGPVLTWRLPNKGTKPVEVYKR